MRCARAPTVRAPLARLALRPMLPLAGFMLRL
jgi:hypothetical protein